MLTRTIFNEGGLPDLEPADRALVDRLVADPRASGRDLAKALDCSEANISRRLNRLVAEHAVRIRAFMSLDRAGLSASAAMIVQSPDPMALGKRLAAHEWIHFVATTGPLDGPADALVLHGSAANGTAFRALLDRDLVTDPDVTVVDARMVLDSFGTQATTDAHRHNWRGGRPLDRVNRAIIRELQRDGRATFAALGEVAGISSTAAAERFRHLMDDQLIRMLAFPEPSRIGLRATGVMFVRSSVATDAALDAARVEAMKKARARAELYARAAGLRVVRIRTIAEGGGYSPPQPMLYARAMAAAAPDTPVAAGEVSLSTNVTVTFELAP